MRKSAFFAIILATLGIAHAPAFGDDKCEIKLEKSIFGNSKQNTISITGFQTGKPELTDTCKEQFISELPKYLKEDTINILVIGYASRLGNATNNAELATNRADHIRTIIQSQQKGITKDITTNIRSAGESTHNTIDFGENNPENNPKARSVEVTFSYPQLTQKYQDIIFLKGWKEKHLSSSDTQCNADELFTEYIKHLRVGSLDKDFPQNNINTAMENCKVAAGNNTDAANEIINYTEIRGIYGELTTIHKKFSGNISVWKNADGKFNTARLASDSIAGVVLGTAGGLITSNVVKKNQIENGFEDIKCTIGGQNVAAWGDQFRVGIQ